MKVGKLAAIALLAGASAGFSAPVLSAPLSVDIRFAPPAPRYEVVPVSRPGHVWAPGYWDYRNYRYHWVAGHWVRERPGYYYSSPTWVQHGDRWQLNRGGWRDYDRDGIANRHDRDLDNDRVQNRHDRDRDGYSNNRDSRPDNPRRH